ncbi:hypothetical protein PHYBOEH_001904 [Phytophthora boehmeriae]|uniref:Uncharacterized protein n=1 Tax=Phytophthora boehmeriae TaxID=109152 RepID=A0A8T1WT91_9STRA|nr:hypothetical protein PHYBOEH_001904 [Phytophthora boehmeriae]
MDGYRQTLLGRALADALQELEQTEGVDCLDGDLLFSLFDEAMRLELRDSKKRTEEGQKTFTHGSLELSGQVTAFNRFMDDWSVQTRVASGDLKLDQGVMDLHLPPQQQREVAMRLKLRRRK